jgi:ABC-type uncharacterized transport system permease subunit
MVTSTAARGGVSIPLLCALLLMGAGVAMILLPVKAAARPCGGNAVTVLASPEASSAHSRECHDSARNELIFGTAVAVTGLGLAGFSVSILRRTP